MRTIGLMHGMSSIATGDYYGRVTNRFGEHSGGQRPEMILASVNSALKDHLVQTTPGQG